MAVCFVVLTGLPQQRRQAVVRLGKARLAGEKRTVPFHALKRIRFLELARLQKCRAEPVSLPCRRIGRQE